VRDLEHLDGVFDSPRERLDARLRARRKRLERRDPDLFVGNV
jgi:hypothetical protein